MKLLPEVPTEEMIIAYEGSLHRPLSILGYKAMWRTAPEVKDEPVFWQYRHNMNGLTGLWHNCFGVNEYEQRKQMPEYETRALYTRPSPRIAELEAEVARLRSVLRRVTKCVDMGHLADYDDELASEVREAIK